MRTLFNLDDDITDEKLVKPAVAKKKQEQPVCQMVEEILDGESCKIVQLANCLTESELCEQFAGAPQFQGIDLVDIWEKSREYLGVILVGENDYYLKQAAMYMTTMAVLRQSGATTISQRNPSGSEFWNNQPISAMEATDESAQGLGLMLLHPKMLEVPKEPMKVAPIQVVDVPHYAVYFGAKHGNILSPKVVEQMTQSQLDGDGTPVHRFIGLHQNQVDLHLCHELQFTYGFQVVHVGTADESYLARVLHHQVQSCGLSLMSGFDSKKVLSHLRQLQGERFCESDLRSAVLLAKQYGPKNKPCTTEDLCFQPATLVERKSATDQMKNMVGLEHIKQTIAGILAVEQLKERQRAEGRPIIKLHRHMAFSGPPGTGKTVCAQILAAMFQEAGCGSGTFLEVGREDLIGSFVGHTAPKIAKLFERAHGGVLFIDEVGALVGTANGAGSDVFAEEAVNALVYHMDRCPETVVIFASYTQEMERFLQVNPGLSSRIPNQLIFPSYDNQNLLEILHHMAHQRGYSISSEISTKAGQYFSTLRKRNPAQFGNGREVRRLLNGAEEQMALRILDGGTIQLTIEDFTKAMDKLLPREKDVRIIGFCG